MRLLDVTTTHLQMSTPSRNRPVSPPTPSIRLLHLPDCPPDLYRHLYRTVGRDYNWYLRYHWTDDQILATLRDPAVSLHVLYDSDTPAGFAELRRHLTPDDDSVEIQYFGLLPDFIGRGLGKYLLAAATDRAWSLRPKRVWLHTCSLDHPAAFPNYLAGGFEPYKTETGTEPALQP